MWVTSVFQFAWIKIDTTLKTDRGWGQWLHIIRKPSVITLYFKIPKERYSMASTVTNETKSNEMYCIVCKIMKSIRVKPSEIFIQKLYMRCYAIFITYIALLIRNRHVWKFPLNIIWHIPYISKAFITELCRCIPASSKEMQLFCFQQAPSNCTTINNQNIMQRSYPRFTCILSLKTYKILCVIIHFYWYTWQSTKLRPN